LRITGAGYTPVKKLQLVFNTNCPVPDMEEICQGHILDPDMQDWARREFLLLKEGGFLYAARRITRMAGTLPTNPYRILGSGPESRAYAEAAGAEDWKSADKICLDRLKAINYRAYLEMLRMECLAGEFTRALAEEASRATMLYRWMDWEELSSYKKGKFESRTEAGGKCRRYKPFSLGLNGYARVRPVGLAVPVDYAIRNALRPAAYTAVPWPVLSEDERIGSRKHLVNAHETECRVPDGICVPKGTHISVERRVLDSTPDSKRYRALLESLEGAITVRLT